VAAPRRGLLGRPPPTALAEPAITMLAREVPSGDAQPVADGEQAGRLDVLQLLVATGLADSNGAARRLLQQGGVSLNKRKLGAEERFVAAADVRLAGGWVMVGKGKRDVGLARLP
ncbi:MAG: tyrosine--tRNA ligase, partial [Gemmatimonadota bacterium]